jgi:hypothetical protein
MLALWTCGALASLTQSQVHRYLLCLDHCALLEGNTHLKTCSDSSSKVDKVSKSVMCQYIYTVTVRLDHIYGKIWYGYGTVLKAGDCLLFAVKGHFGSFFQNTNVVNYISPM